MSIREHVKKQGLAKVAIDAGGSIHPLLLPKEITNGTGLMNPSIFVDNNNILVNLRHVNYTLYHSEYKKFQHEYGPLQYLHPENDRNLRTWNYLCVLNTDLSIKSHTLVDTTAFDVPPKWEFVGLEDARLFKWDNKLYMSGVRRDTTTNGQGRMELTEINCAGPQQVKEIKRTRLPAPGEDATYCEKNWMPILDQPYHYVKWSNPTEVVKYDVDTGVTTTVHLDERTYIPNLPDFRGGSQVIPYGDYYLAVTHEVDLFKSENGEKDAAYTHRFVVWDKSWNLVKYTDAFSFMKADIEFCCGAAFVDDNLLVSFGYQDNCAFILKIPGDILRSLLEIETSKEFDWGKIKDNRWFYQQVNQEIFSNDDYQRYFSVEENDVVVDIGASVGPFAYKIAEKKPKKIFCLEPERELYNTLVKNTQDLPIVALNKAIAATTGKQNIAGVFDANIVEIDTTTLQTVDAIDFKTFIREYNIDSIDFLKMDCEGGEYSVFTDDNFDWIVKNTKKIAAEIHLHSAEQKDKFRHFRDTYLRHFTNIQVLSLDYVDIKHSLFTDWFIEYYSAVMVYIDNRSVNVWDMYPAPTLEVTTTIPAKGCVVDCVFCPQRTLEKAYTDTRILTLENFKQLINKVPTKVRITFAGFTEPWLNKYCTDMLLYAHEQQHPVSVFTTAVGMTVEDCERIVDVPYAGNPNGGFVLHLPDSELLAKHPITAKYLETLAWFKENSHRIQNFTLMTMGAEVHPAVKHLFDSAPNYAMWSRGGNLIRESLLNPRLIQLKDRWQTIYHEGNMTCGCEEHLYHNILLPNGDVSLCCMDYSLDNILGNLYKQTYSEIMPQPQTCYDMCKYCENATPPAQPIVFYK